MKNRFFVALRMTKRLDSCPFGFAQGRLFAGMTDQFLRVQQVAHPTILIQDGICKV